MEDALFIDTIDIAINEYVCTNDITPLKKLLDDTNTFQRYRDVYVGSGKLPIIWESAIHNMVDGVEYALSKGEDPNAMPRNTALLSIANEKVLNTLLKHNANPNILDNHGCTPIMYIAKRGSFNSMISLIKAGADPHHKCNYGWTALDYAIRNKQWCNSCCIKHLLSLGVRINFDPKPSLNIFKDRFNVMPMNRSIVRRWVWSPRTLKHLTQNAIKHHDNARLMARNDYTKELKHF